MGWFYGFKLHLIINDQGGIISVKTTIANVDDRKPVPAMTDNLWGSLYVDKGYISGPLEQELVDEGVTLVDRCEKEHESQGDEALGAFDAQETIYYRNSL